MLKKNPADLEMLQAIAELNHVLENKDVDLIRVDGAWNEGPVHLEV